MNNIFISFCEDYFNFINDKLINVDKIYNKRKINCEKVIFNDKLKKDFLEISKLLSNRYNVLEDYCLFIRFAEKCFMYKNCETNNIYAEIVDNKKILYYKNDDYKVKITYEITKIKKPSSNIALSMISDESETNIKFITIEIVRNFGKQMKNIYKFVYGEEINIEKSDEILLNIVFTKMNREIFDSFCEILKSIIYIYTGISSKEIIMTEVIENGLWIRKCSNK